MLYCIGSHYSISHYIILQYITYHITLHGIKLHHIILHYITYSITSLHYSSHIHAFPHSFFLLNRPVTQMTWISVIFSKFPHLVCPSPALHDSFKLQRALPLCLHRHGLLKEICDKTSPTRNDLRKSCSRSNHYNEGENGLILINGEPTKRQWLPQLKLDSAEGTDIVLLIKPKLYKHPLISA